MKYLLSVQLSCCFLFAFLLINCNTSSKKVDVVNHFKEQYRSQIHFTPDSNWMNDPNGLVYYKGEYHLFFQHYPDSTVWGPMHWGHAVSSDLVHWQRLPIALYPDSLGYIFSGSVVIDANNTSGLGTKENPPMIAVFTYHNPKEEKTQSKTFQNQGLAFSVDGGRTWTKYNKNPVLKNPGLRDFRDPKVSWNKEAHQWIMVLAAGDRVKFYSSPDLLTWSYESDFGEHLGAHGGVWECPDLFPMKINNKTKWVLIVSINPGGTNGGSATQYFVGEFDGHFFKNENPAIKWIDYGKDNYAGVTWSNIPAKDGRTLFMGWMSNWQYAEIVPTVRWRSANTIARELNLIFENNEYIVTSKPVKELENIRDKVITINNDKISGEKQMFVGSTSVAPCEIHLNFQLTGSASMPDSFGIILSNKLKENIQIGFNRLKNEVYINRLNSGMVNFSKEFPGIFTAPCQLIDNKLSFDLIIDAASVELFAQEGRVVMTNIFFSAEPYSSIIAFSNKGEIYVSEFEITKLKSIW